MPRSRFSLFLSGTLTLAAFAFLWLPVLRLYVLGSGWSLIRLSSAFFSPLSQALLTNTFLLSSLAAAIAVVVGIPIALAAARGPRGWRAPLLLLCALPLALPPTLMAAAYLEYSRTPPARSIASLAADHALSINATFIAAPVLALCFFPIVVFALWSALQALPHEWEEAALLFGNPVAAWPKILAPLLAPAIWGAAALVAALSMWEMGAPDLLDAKTYSVQIYRAFSAGESSGSAAVTALPMFLLGGLFFVPVWRGLRFYDRWRIEHVGVEHAHAGNTATPRLTQLRSVVLTILALCCLLFSPIAPLLVFIDQAQPRDIFLQVWDANRDEIRNTFLAPIIAASGIVLLSLVLVWCWREFSTRTQRTVLALGLTPLLFAPILLAIALLEFYNRALFDMVYDSRYGLLLVGFAARFLPLGLLWMNEALRRMPRILEEAAHNLGASRAQAAWMILLPLLTPSALALFAVLFALCAGELSLAVLLNAPGGQTLPVPIFNQMHIGATESVAALSLTLVTMSGSALLLLLAIWEKLKAR